MRWSCSAQNGEPIRPEQGFPIRLFLPGYEGNANIKWLRRLKVVDKPYETREETSRYTDLMADGSARQFTLVMDAKSVVTHPSGGQRARRTRLSRDRGHRLDRPRPSDASRGVRRRRENLERRRPAGADPRRARTPASGCRGSGTARKTVVASRVTDETGYVQPTSRGARRASAA